MLNIPLHLQLIIGGVIYILLSPYHDGNAFQKQSYHVSKIMETKLLDPMKSDYYFQVNMQTFSMCETLQRMIISQNKYTIHDNIPTYDFQNEELNELNREYMNAIYNPTNFPYTYRHDVYIQFTNKTANHLYKIVCKDYYKDEPSSKPAYGLCIFMIIAMLYRFVFITF